jgi:hypothetical protein
VSRCRYADLEIGETGDISGNIVPRVKEKRGHKRIFVLRIQTVCFPLMSAVGRSAPARGETIADPYRHTS